MRKQTKERRGEACIIPFVSHSQVSSTFHFLKKQSTHQAGFFNLIFKLTKNKNQLVLFNLSIKTYLFIELKLLYSIILFSGIHYQFSSVIRSCLILCYPMDCSTQGFPVHHQLPELTQTDVQQAGDSIQPSHELWPDRLLCPWNSPGQNTRVGSHSLLQGIFPAQGSNSGLPRYRRILYHLSHQGISQSLIPFLPLHPSLS